MHFIRYEVIRGTWVYVIYVPGIRGIEFSSFYLLTTSADSFFWFFNISLKCCNTGSLVRVGNSFDLILEMKGVSWVLQMCTLFELCFFWNTECLHWPNLCQSRVLVPLQWSLMNCSTTVWTIGSPFSVKAWYCLIYQVMGCN